MMDTIIITIIFMIPILFTVWNIITFILYLIKHKDKKHYKFIEVIAICIGLFYTYVY